MEPVLGEQASFTYQRSQSSSNISSNPSDDYKHIHKRTENEDLPRSASFSSLSLLSYENERVMDYFNHTDVGFDSLSISGPREGNLGKEGTKYGGTPEKPTKPQVAGRRKSSVAGWMSRVTGNSTKRESVAPKPSLANSQQPLPIPTRRPSLAPSKNSRSMVSLDDRSSSACSSRSPSPHKKVVTDLMDYNPDDYSTAASSVSSASPKQSFISLSQQSDKSDFNSQAESAGKGLMRRGTQLLKRSKKSQGDSCDGTGCRSSNASMVSLGGISSSSMGGATTPVASRPNSRGLRDRVIPRSILPSPPKDELWVAFRSLDSDYQKFVAKTSALKTNVVRSTLLPFLRNHFYHDHPSTKQLHPEHLDRRVTVLNRWWKGLMDMLDMQNGMSGVDRPVILEAITAIMERPEWRQSPSLFAPLSDNSLPSNKSCASLSSEASQSVADSVHHSIRSTFVRNLNFQMSIIVEKMSLRHAPASLVTFCGKATAYAFFFCPGIADALARLWTIPFETIKRVADEFGLPRRNASHADQDEIIAAFPPNLHSLGWTSPRAIVNQLRTPATLPAEVAKIAWQGTWRGRWCGRDSDLFYVFCKHYHMLMEDFVPANTPLVEKARAPAFVLVHAQIVTILDGTLHRKPPAGDHLAGSLPLVDDVMAGADASVAALPLSPSSNIARLMCENRLIMLVRDFLADRASDAEEAAQRSFAESFLISVKVSTKKVSLYDHNACFILCDFIEELLSIYIRYHTSDTLQVDFIDWMFWLDVCKKMLESENTVTEIRLLSFIYTTWNMLTATDSRKETICLDWLLSEVTFEKFFMHWCPMVRAYFMRLLVWRICRCENGVAQLKEKVLTTVSNRLKKIWSYYLYQKQIAIKNKKPRPSSAPCHPAPGRRLLIIRNDNQSPAAGLFLSFNGIVSGAANQEKSIRRHSIMLSPPCPTAPPVPRSKDDDSTVKRRWSIMGKKDPSACESPPKLSPNAKLEAARQQTAAARSRPTSFTAASWSSSSVSSTPLLAPKPASYRAFCFKFSLEWHPGQLMTVSERRAFNSDRQLSLPKLPEPANSYLLSHVVGTADDVAGVDKSQGQEKGYAGRALAEWLLLVREHDSFVDRRRAEGVPSLSKTEVPTLGVDGLRRSG